MWLAGVDLSCQIAFNFMKINLGIYLSQVQVSTNEALSLFSQMLRTQRRGHARRQSPKPQVGSQPSDVKGEACWGQAGPIHAGHSKPTPASLNPSHASCARP